MHEVSNAGNKTKDLAGEIYTECKYMSMNRLEAIQELQSLSVYMC